MATLEELIIRAYQKAGKQVPKPTIRAVNNEHSSKKVKNGSKPKQVHRPGKRQKVSTQPKIPEIIRIKHWQQSEQAVPQIKKYAKQAKSKPDDQDDLPFESQFRIEMEQDVCPAWSIGADIEKRELLVLDADGSRLQFESSAQSHTREKHELKIGLDFGTSTVKVVIGDVAMKKTFAVQFYDSVGVANYLLPTRLFMKDGVASLKGGDEVYQDLKLRLIDGLDDEENLLRAALYLALVLRYSRAWVFDKLKPIYNQYELLWSLAIGFPSAHVGEMESIYRRLSLAAWVLAKLPVINLSISDARNVMSELALRSSLKQEEIDKELELAVVPEIAAQVYGHVNSDGFDPHGQKVFLMADIGGGTVDAAIFRVTKSKGKNNFQFYTTTVQPKGAFYLHQYRLVWWLRAATHHDGFLALHELIADSLVSPDKTDLIPDWVQDYFPGVSLTFTKPEYNPDKVFYRDVLKQVRDDTFKAAFIQAHWSQSELKNTPFYLCGGGSRSAFYKQLIDNLKKSEGFTWLKADHRRLLLPENLQAPGLAQHDYDRLSVAYGLSLGGIGSVVKELPKPREKPVVNDSWKDKYVDASMM